QGYEELLALDLGAILAGEEAYTAFQRRDPLFLICTNGQRDRCCAKFGWPVYEALRETYAGDLWQSTHIGGHRYAPNLLFLPHSVNYGLCSAEEAFAAVEAHYNGRLYDLAHYRGRTYYPPHVQAADYFLRRDLHFQALTGLRLLEDLQLDENSWRVRFLLVEANETHTLHVHRDLTAEKHLVSCTSPKEKVVERYRLQVT
ncbi:MAG: sucrase ferredoxin, partial [Anaerolineae bacterium]